MNTRIETETPPPATDGRADGTGVGIAVGVAAAVSVGVLLVLLLAPPVEPVWDQSFISYRFSGGYPSFEEGIVAHLLVGLVNAVVPYSVPLTNTLIRSLAALMYLGSAGLLAWSLTGRERLAGYVLFLLLLVTARFPFLWLSSELFAGAFLMLFLWSLTRRHSFGVTALFLVLFTLCKADLVLPGALVGAYLALRPHPVPRWKRAGALVAMATALALPALLFATSHYAQFGGRAWVSFGQHYGELVRLHQLGEGPPGWDAWPRYLEAAFPGAESVSGAILGHPRTYAHFIGLSTVESAIRLWATRLLVLVPVAVFCFRGMRRSLRVTSLLLLTSLVPVVMLSFLHQRYQARFYPLVLFIIFAGLAGGGHGRKRERIVLLVLGIVVLWQTWGLAAVLASAYWLPD